MNKDPLVSVVIPCYNHGQFVAEAVDSILAQTYSNLEIIIVNDGSTDEFTNNYLNDFKRPKTKVLTTPNQGLPSARNTGIKAAKGELILPLDADDKIHPEFLATTVPLLQNNPNLGVVGTHVQVFGHESWQFTPTYQLKTFLFENQITATSLFRKRDWEAVGGYDPNLKVMEDYGFWIQLLNKGFEITIVPRLLFYYRKHKPTGEVRKHSMRAISREAELECKLYIASKAPELYSKHIDDAIAYIQHLKWSLNDAQSTRSIGNYFHKAIKLLKSKLA